MQRNHLHTGIGGTTTFEVHISLEAIEGTTAVSTNEIVENVHNGSFLRLF